MTEGHIFIQGIISPWQDKFAEDYGEVNIKQVTQQIQDNKDAEKLIVHIHSPGGDVDEGFGIHDILVTSGKEIETRIEGLCASIATVVAMAGSTRLMTENSEFMIHNPWGQPKPGDAEEIQKYADQLKKVENKVAQCYADNTSKSFDEMLQLMEIEEFITAEKAKELGFITGTMIAMKAVATVRLNQSNKNITMNKQEFEKSVDTKFEAIFNRLKEFVKGSNIKALTITAADGTVLDFGDQVETVEEIAVGMTATIEGGGVPSGDFVMPDARTFVFGDAAGTLTEIKEAEGDDDVDALKAKITELEAELETANAQNTTTVEAIKTLNKEIKDFKSQIKSDIDGLDPESFEKHDRNQKQNRFADLKPKIAV